MRKALIVGIDYYERIRCLRGCVNDANSVKATLERHADGTINFATPLLLTGTGPTDLVTASQLKDTVRELFKEDSEIALLYFSGHGYVGDLGGFLCTSECSKGDDGLSLTEVMTFAKASRAKNKIIVLDCCHSGAAGDHADHPALAELKEGTTILTASTADQYAMEEDGAGLFTGLFVDALSGGAANLVGDITPGSVYAHIDQSLGPWKQRPVFKTNVKSFVSLRKATPPIAPEELRAIATHFPKAGYQFRLDPTYEPERSTETPKDIPPPDPARNAVFRVLQNYVRVGLVRPVDAPHMWHAAMHSKSCQLTVLGEYYRKLVAEGLL